MSESLPVHRAALKDADFTDWLAAAGAVIQTPLEWNAVRYVFESKTHIIYFNAGERLKFTGDSAEHYLRFLFFRGIPGKMGGAKRRTTLEALRERDGPLCFYSGVDLLFGPRAQLANAPQTGTIEHLTPRSLGGKNALGNLVLCTYEINQWLDNADLVTKLKLRDDWWAPGGAQAQVTRRRLGQPWLTPEQTLIKLKEIF